LLIYGECHPDIDRIAERYGSKRIPTRNCISALLGERKKQLDKQGNYFYITSGWLKNWKKIFIDGLKWDEVDARQNFGFYDKILMLDSRVRDITDEEILEFFTFTQKEIETLNISLDNFKNLILTKIKGGIH